MTGLVILNYNDYITTLRLYNTIKDYKIFDKIVIVDNYSTDDSVNKLRKGIKSTVELIVAENNLGYSYGNNLGISYLLKLSFDYIFIANPDILVNENVAYNLIQVLMNNKTIAIVAPLMKNIDGAINYYSAFSYPTYWHDFLMNFHLYIHYYNTHRKPCYDIEAEIGYPGGLSGAFFLINAKLLKEDSFFDDDFFLYGEEYCYATKLQRLGYKAAVLPGLTYFHDHSTSTRKNISSLKQLRLLQNSIKKYYIKYQKIGIIKEILITIAQNYLYFTALIKEIYEKHK